MRDQVLILHVAGGSRIDEILARVLDDLATPIVPDAAVDMVLKPTYSVGLDLLTRDKIALGDDSIGFCEQTTDPDQCPTPIKGIRPKDWLQRERRGRARK